VWEDSVGLGKWLLLAIVLEALLVRYVPQNVIATTLGSQGVFAIPLASLISVPLYLNGVGAIPIAAGLLRQGMESAASATFLLGGAVTTIPAMVAVRSVVNNKVFGLYLAVGLLGSIAVGFLVAPFL
jgi:uncharacterized membrane protein YraQ (UPF0718 family)